MEELQTLFHIRGSLHKQGPRCKKAVQYSSADVWHGFITLPFCGPCCGESLGPVAGYFLRFSELNVLLGSNFNGFLSSLDLSTSGHSNCLCTRMLCNCCQSCLGDKQACAARHCVSKLASSMPLKLQPVMNTPGLSRHAAGCWGLLTASIRLWQ